MLRYIIFKRNKLRARMCFHKNIYIEMVGRWCVCVCVCVDVCVSMCVRVFVSNKSENHIAKTIGCTTFPNTVARSIGFTTISKIILRTPFVLHHLRK